MPSMIKFMVLDVDGTITDQNRIISPEAIKSVRLAIENGMQISLVSGKNWNENEYHHRQNHKTFLLQELQGTI